jgi:hypothetical protein
VEVRALDSMTAIVMATRMRARDRAEVLSTMPNADLAAWAVGITARCGDAWALIDPAGLPVAMGGALELWPGVVQTWLVASDELPRHAVRVLRAARDAHERLARAGIHRFQTWAMVGYDTAYRWLARLGYEVEGRAAGWAATAPITT